ncbi:MAG: hypothetical protein QM606_07670, partial [Leucobacter sp.]
MPSARRSRTRAVAGLALALGLVSSATAPSLAAPARGDDAAQDRAAAAAELVIAPRDPVLLGEENADDDIAFSLLVRNPEEQTLPSGSIEIRISAQSLDDAGQLDESATTLHLAEARIGETGPGDEQVATVSVPRDQLPAFIPRGVHTIEAAFTPDASDSGAASDASLSATTPVVWRGPAAAQADGSDPAAQNDDTTAGSADTTSAEASLRLGVIVPLVLPEEIRT